MKKSILITLSLLLITITAMGKDVKIVINSTHKGEIKMNFLKQGIMTMPICDLVVKNGRNEVVTDKITEYGIYNIGFNLNNFYSNYSVLIDPAEETFVLHFDDHLKISFEGKGSGFNRSLAILGESYKSQLRAINSFKAVTQERTKTAFDLYEKMTKDINTFDVTKQEKQMLLGYVQGWLLSNVYTVVSTSKTFGKMSMDLVIEENHADFMVDMKLRPYVHLYPTWYSALTEFLYSRLNSGKIKIKDVNSWISDMARSIENPDLRDAYIVECLKKEILMEYGTGIKSRFEKSKKLISNQSLLPKIDELEQKIPTLNKFSEGKYVGDMVFENANGEKIALSQFKGKYLFIDIWSTGCNPCIGEIPYMKKIEHRFADKEIEWVSLSMDNDLNVWKKFLNEHTMKGNQLICPDGFRHPFCKIIGLRGIPRFLLIDKEGNLLNPNTYRPSNQVLKEQLKFILNPIDSK